MKKAINKVLVYLIVISVLSLINSGFPVITPITFRKVIHLNSTVRLVAVNYVVGFLANVLAITTLIVLIALLNPVHVAVKAIVGKVCVCLSCLQKNNSHHHHYHHHHHHHHHHMDNTTRCHTCTSCYIVQNCIQVCSCSLLNREALTKGLIVCHRNMHCHIMDRGIQSCQHSWILQVKFYILVKQDHHFNHATSFCVFPSFSLFRRTKR